MGPCRLPLTIHCVSGNCLLARESQGKRQAYGLAVFVSFPFDSRVAYRGGRELLRTPKTLVLSSSAAEMIEDSPTLLQTEWDLQIDQRGHNKMLLVEL